MVRFPQFRPTILTVVLAALLLVVLGGCASQMNTFDPKSDTTDSILTIYIITIVAASLVGVAVLGQPQFQPGGLLWCEHDGDRRAVVRGALGQGDHAVTPAHTRRAASTMAAA